MKRRTRYNKFSRLIVVALCILVFSITGIGYAYWTEFVSTDVKVSTGEVNIEFLGQNSFNSEDNLVIMPIEKVDNNTEKIRSTANMHLGYPVTLKLKIKNIGTVPMKLKEGYVEDFNQHLAIKLVIVKPPNFTKEYIPINDYESKLKFSYVKLDAEVIQPDREGTIELMITGLEDKNYYFDLKIPFEQFNSSREANSAWSKMLDFSGEVQVFK